jgi:hypothetical protein
MSPEAPMEKTSARLFKTALTLPAFAGLTVVSYTVHGSIAATVFLYDALCRRGEHGRTTRVPRVTAGASRVSH